MLKFIGVILILLIITGCQTTQQYIQWKKDVNYNPPQFENTYNNCGERIGFTVKKYK